MDGWRESESARARERAVERVVRSAGTAVVLEPAEVASLDDICQIYNDICKFPIV
jgi:hypothetical protein